MLIGLSQPLLEWGWEVQCGGMGSQGNTVTTHCHLLSAYDVRDLSAELTRLISLSPHNIPEGSIAIRQLKFRWESHTATAAQLRSMDWGVGLPRSGFLCRSPVQVWSQKLA